MNFEEAVALNNLGEMIDQQYGRWGKFTEPAAKAIQVAAMTEVVVVKDWTQLASALAITVMNESTFNLNQTPNINLDPNCPAKWDFGPCQINFFWNVLETWEGNVVMRGLPWREVFGKPPFLPSTEFNGDVITHFRACLRIIQSKKLTNDAIAKDEMEAKVVLYTGGDKERRSHRREDWRKYSNLFQIFFEAYHV